MTIDKLHEERLRKRAQRYLDEVARIRKEFARLDEAARVAGERDAKQRVKALKRAAAKVGFIEGPGGRAKKARQT